MDFEDPYTAMAEENAFEDEYAAEMEMLNEFENKKTDEDLGDISESQSRRKLFDDSTPSTSRAEKHNWSFSENLDSDLMIDEEPDYLMPDSKRARMEYMTTKKHSLPTTLDEDMDRIRMNKDIEKDSEGVSSGAMIQKILEYRERKGKDSEEFLKQGETRSDNTDRLQIRKVLPYPPVHSDFISATSTEGVRCYMRIRDTKPQKYDINSMLGGKSLLPQSVSELRQAIMAEKDNAILKESHELTERIRRRNIQPSNPPPGVPSEDVAILESVGEIPDAQNLTDQNVEENDLLIQESSAKNGLWLDKFAPSQYTHLLSEENVNRSLLRWLKMWDFVVFGRKVHRKEKPKPENNNFTKKTYFDIKRELDEKTDEYERPHFKAALLYGPPGLGKTTLAHIIARHAGYHVVEMNASDDRSAATFRNKLEQTTQMKSVLGQDERPNCLIIDEIDGAPQAAIDVLLATMNKARKKDDKKTGKRKGGTNNILLRPIICICNDLYVPSLRQLRQQSFVLNFPPTRPSKLASRLAQLCRVQKLQCDISTLLKLCDKADNDIRSCVNTLQFVKASGQQKLSSESVNAFQIGQKDQHKSIFHVWSEIFQLPKNQSSTDNTAKCSWISEKTGEAKSTALSKRFYNVYHLVSANGEYEKTFQGVYENFLQMKIKDHDLACVTKAQEWILFYDKLSAMNLRLQEWSVFHFFPYFFVLFHMMYSCIHVPKIMFPTQSFEASKNRQKSDNLLRSLYMEMTPRTQCFTSSQTAILDSIPYVLSIMTPTLRPVNFQLYTPAEKKMLQDLVTTMISYNLSFKQRRNDEGQYDYALEPNVAEICEFDDTQSKMKLPYSTRQLIAKEVEMERMRRSERLLEAPTITDTSASKEKGTNPPANHKKRLEDTISKAPPPKEKPVVDFFSRFTKIKKVVETDKGTKKPAPIRDPGIGNSQIWYKFHEGFSNAVRQTVYVKDFL